MRAPLVTYDKRLLKEFPEMAKRQGGKVGELRG
jgi:hypothetical protein